MCGRGDVCVCKSAKGAHREEVGNVLGKSRRKRRRRKVIKALYGDGQASLCVQCGAGGLSHGLG